MTQEKLLWSVQEAALSLCMNENTMRRYLRNGKIKGVKLNAIAWRIPSDEVKRIASLGISIGTKKNGSTMTVDGAAYNLNRELPYES